MESDGREPEPEPGVRNEISGMVGGNSYQARDLTVNHVTNIIRGMAKRKRGRPNALPPAPTVFVNRLPTLADLTRFVTEPGRSSAAVVTLSGLGGVGKTAVAAHWSRQVAGDLYPDGTMYVDLRNHRANGGVGMSAVLAELLIQCGWETWELANDLPGRRAQFQAHVKDKRVLVVVDHVENEAEVTPLRPESPDSALLIAGHSGEEFVMERRDLTVRPLDDAAAFELVAKLINADKPEAERVEIAEAERAEILELVRLCGGVPKVLGVAVGPVRRHQGISVADVVASLREDLERAPGSGDIAAMSEIVADRAYRSLRPETARLYRVLGHVPSVDISKPAILTLAASLGGNGVSMLVELLDHHLLDPNGKDRFELSGLVRVHARQLADTEADPCETQETVAALVAWYASWAHAADKAIVPYRTRVFETAASVRPPFADDADAARDWFEAERHNLLAIQRFCAKQGVSDPRWLDLVMRLGESMWVMYIGGRYLEDWLESSRLAVAAAVDAGHEAAEARLRAFLARALMENAAIAADENRRFDEAEHELAQARDLPMADGVVVDLRASAIEFSGRLLSYREHHREAIERYRRAMAIFAAQAERTDLPDEHRRASARGVTLQLQFIGRCLLKLGELPDAVDHLRQAESRMLDIGHDRDVATIRTELGEALRRMGEVDEAFTVVSMAVDTLANKKWYRIETAALWELSLLAEIRGETELERTCLDRLRDIYSVTANPRLKAVEERLERLADG